ncbi:MAG: hypothetical protein ACLS6Y_01690 [Streptococcus salivarius]
MKINHFPNISLDISETKEKYLTEKNERIIEELCQVLVEHSKIESDIFLKHQEINTYKKENNLPHIKLFLEKWSYLMNLK